MASISFKGTLVDPLLKRHQKGNFGGGGGGAYRCDKKFGQTR